MDCEKEKALLEAMLADNAKQALPREIAKHLARVSLLDLKGVSALHPQIQPLAKHLVELATASGL